MAEKESKQLSIAESKAPIGKAERPMIPPVDIYETNDGMILVADMPGVSKEKIEVKIEKNVLEIRGEITDLPGKEVSPVYAELTGKEYYRAFSLGPEFDLDKIEASIEAGMLRLFLPKIESEKPRKIEIKSI